uniref:NADH dehydrogenase subunit 5 n=1 Tax=Alectorobius peropteryx TaxID=1265610 RepID=UPI002238B7E1|nr:NADH dehydrogenase subunit 5 [Alectorobius peropteryx]UYB78503.1 NADH dehydrogenase subunit 5 [Alectorobius peropteryx]UYB78516.1 NADH dehydrogenase subunit 5 [Alectorobius peropteryx]
MFLSWGLMLVILSCCFLFFGLLNLINYKVVLLEYFFLMVDNFEMKFYFLFDWMSMLFISVVLLISGMVLFYSNDYMGNESYKNFFLYSVLMFVGSMILVILSPNLFMILMGWDGLGFTSYCLVIFYQNYKSNVAGMVTMMSNRVGDIMILLSLVMLLNFGGFDFIIYSKMYWLCGYMLLIAGMTKSAQIPFSAWLPAAMAAPTPVSSLVHSSTLVTAGVYFLIRLNLLMGMFEYSKFLLFFSLLTMMMAGVGAAMEVDLKKIIALSTLSQLGLMMVILSMGKIELSFFHLLAHAVFKAMLFLCVGVMIHKSLGDQDIRYMGSFYLMSPLVSMSFSLANLSLFGMPFLSGFYSKDVILEYIYMHEKSMLVLIVVIISTIFTVIYSLRVMYYSLWKGGVKMVNFNCHWSIYMEVPIFIMGGFVLFFGSLMSWMFISYEFVVLSVEISVVNLVLILGGLWVFLVFFEKMEMMKFRVVWEFLGKMWFLSSFTGPIFSSNVLGGLKMFNYDNGWMEEIGPQGVYKISSKISSIVSWGQINMFSNVMLFSLFIIFMIF